MKAGETLTDAQGTTWVLEAALGRGVWGRTWSVRTATPGAVGVVRVPLAPADFPGRRDADSLAAAAWSLAEAWRDRVAERPHGYLPVAVASVPESPMVIVRRYGASFEARLQAGVGLTEALDILVRAAHALAHASAEVVVHGNLRPSNVFVDDDAHVILTDPWLGTTPSLADAWRRLVEAGARNPWLPPEAVRGGPPVGSFDTWALCQMLFRAASESRGAELPSEGLDRADLATVKDAATARLRAEGANKRFSGRATEKLGAVLARGLSPQTEPSPPYRFRGAVDLLPRLVEVDDLVHPAVESVSKPLLATRAMHGVFDAGTPVEFAVNVGTTAGVTAQDDIATGVQLRDLDTPADRDGRIRAPNARFNVKKYPSGRWRFNFELPDVPPGRYGIRVAFAVKGSEDVTQVTEGTFQVRPQAGYVPPSVGVEHAAPLPFAPVGASARGRHEEEEEGPVAVAEPVDELPAWPNEADPGHPSPIRPDTREHAPVRVTGVDWSPVAPEPVAPLPVAPQAIIPPAPPPLPVVEPMDTVARDAPTVAAMGPPPAPPVPIIPLPKPAEPAPAPPARGWELDYPGPGSTLGTEPPADLPAYDQTSVKPAADDAPPSWLRAWERMLESLGVDGVTAGIGLGGGLFVLMVVLAAALKGCE